MGSLTDSRLGLLFFGAALLATACGGAAGGPLGADPLTAETVTRLLTPADVQDAGGPGGLSVEAHDLKTFAAEIDPAQVEGIDGWAGVSLTSGGRGLLLQVIDYANASSATARLDQARAGPSLAPASQPIGDRAFVFQGGDAGPGVVFTVGARFVSLQSTAPVGDEPLLTAEQVVTIAQVVANRL